MAQGQLEVRPVYSRTGKIGNTTAVSRGMALVFNSATDKSNVVRATASNSQRFAGIARSAIAAPAAADQVILEMLVLGDFPVLNTSGSAISAGAVLLTHASGGVKAKVGETAPYGIVGEALEDCVDGDLFLAWMNPRVQLA